MDILTSVIAGRVYGLNLKDLPLDRLSEQKHKKRRHRFDSKKKLNTMDRAKVAPSPTVQESKPEVASSSAAPVAVVPSTPAKTAEPAKNEGNTAVIPDDTDKPKQGINVTLLLPLRARLDVINEYYISTISLCYIFYES